jgi:hypothetical protein
VTWTDNKTGLPVYRDSPAEAWPLPLFTPGNVVIVEKPRTEAKVVPLRGRG